MLTTRKMKGVIFLAVEAADGQSLLTDQWYENNVANKGDSLF